MSRTSPGTSRPAATEAGNLPRVSQVCAHASSRAAARACRNRANVAASRLSRTRHPVASDATCPNNSG